MGNQEMHIVFASDENFALQLQVAAVSFVKACTGDEFPWVVDILDCGISDQTWSIILDKVETYAKRYRVVVRMDRHQIDMRAYDGYRQWNASRATYARLELPDLLDAVHYCIYSDCDVLFVDNPREMVRQLVLKSKTILGHRNPAVRSVSADESWFLANGLPYNKSNHFCAGLIAMDLAQMRKDGAVQKLHAFMDKYPSPVSVDQSALNWYCNVSGNSGGVLDGNWGLFPMECFGLGCTPISAVHFSGGFAWKGSPSWYEYLTTSRVDSLWIQFASRIFPNANICNKTGFTASAVAFAAACVIRVILSLHLPLPGKKAFLDEMRKVLNKKDGIEATRRALLEGF